jgi:hypothetical protein
MCPYCKDSHKLLFCRDFAKIDVNQRSQFVKSNRLCEICLLSNHVTSECKRSYTCVLCGARHSKLLHVADAPANASTSVLSDQDAVPLGTVNAAQGKASRFHIPTVEVDIANRRFVAVLDTASDTSFCTRRLYDELRLKGRASSFRLNTLNVPRESRTHFVNRHLNSVHGLESSR